MRWALLFSCADARATGAPHHSRRELKLARPALLALFTACLVLSSTLGCASIPPPKVLSEADSVAASPAAKDAKTYAPSAFAAAEKLLKEAHEALENDRSAHAQILAEQAIAAFEEAVALARVARADRRFEEADAKREAAEKELGGLKGDVDR